ncbi:MAG: glycosyltransferase family 4 protein [Thermodesulfobacteriota bacterium]
MSPPLKVIQFTVSAGGVKKHLVDLVSNLDRSRFEVVGLFPHKLLWDKVFSLESEKYKDIFQQLGLPYHLLETPRGLNPPRDLISLLKLIRIIRREKPDVLHTHSSKAGAIGRLAGWLCRVPLILYTPHCMYYQLAAGWKRRLFFWIEKALAGLGHYLIAVSPSEYEELARDFGKQRVILIPNGLDLDSIHVPPGAKAALWASLKLKETDKIVLSVTRLSPQKDVLTLLKAAEVLKKDLPEAVFLIAGDGELAEELKAYAQQAGLETTVRFLGWREDVYALLDLCQVKVLTSLAEGLPYAVLEASALAKPVIGAGSTGLRDCIVPGRTGFLFPPGDYLTLARYIKNILLDPDLAVSLGRNGRGFVEEKFSLKAMIRKTEELYAQIAS